MLFNTCRCNRLVGQLFLEKIANTNKNAEFKYGSSKNI